MPQFSILDFYSIGIGPSSSHTVGPMRAANAFSRSLEAPDVARLECHLYGSLAATGKGHGTDHAIVLGLLGETPEEIDIDTVPRLLAQVAASGAIALPCGATPSFVPSRDLVFHRNRPLPRHPNGMHFCAFNSSDAIVAEEVVYSTGGGFIVNERDWDRGSQAPARPMPHPFDSARELLGHCGAERLSIAAIVLANEAVFRPEGVTRERLDAVWTAMRKCIDRGMRADGILPGALQVPRRARKLHQSLVSGSEQNAGDPLTVLDWVCLYALAVNEENAAGGRVVTAPTNGAAGILPAVLTYAERFCRSPHPDGVHRFLLTAGAIATLYKKNASISGADVGCQGEIGVACSMAAGALVEYLGGTPNQVEFAAEIGMEHNLGLTCDPIGGLVQIPCIERNAMGSVKAINASRLAMRSSGAHFVSLDKVIQTMKATGHDMKTKYKETSRGGLAVNVVEC